MRGSMRCVSAMMHAVGEAPLDDPAKVGERILVGAAEKDDQIEPAGREIRLQAVEHRHEERLALRRALTVGGDHEADHAGGALAQAAARLVRRIAERLGGLEDALARLGADVAPPVQRPRNGADRDIQMARKIVDIQARASPETGARYPCTARTRD